MSELANIAEQFQGLPMDSLIGGPLNAIADANGKMAKSQTQFILESGFNISKRDVVRQEWKDGKWDDVKESLAVYDPIMINLSLSRPSLDESGNQLLIEEYDDNGNMKKVAAPNAEFSIKVPLLSVIPINSLGVQSAEINFEMEVKSSSEEKTAESTTKKTAGEGSFEASMGWGPFKVSVKGSASYSSEDAKSRDTHYQKSNNAKYTVNVKAGQLPLPTGVTTILDIYAKNIFPVSVKPNEKVEQPEKVTTNNSTDSGSSPVTEQ